MKNPFAKSVQGLKIIIVGCGKVGTTLVERLSKEKHHITIIDQKADVVQRVASTYDVMGVTGNGGSFSVQIEADIQSADLFIAVTESDELNLLCCTIAKKVANCAAIARVRNPDYIDELNYLRGQLGISLIINPEWDTATEIARLLRLPTALGINSFAKGHAELVKFRVPKDNILCNMAIAGLKNLKTDLLICGIERDGKLIIPDGSDVFLEGDAVSFIATPVNTQSFFKQIGVDTHQVRDCMIIGGGTISYYLAKQLEDMNINVKLIEINEKKCEDLSLHLPKTLVIHGDGSDEELLLEEGIENIEAFVPLTGLDEENILLTLFAKSRSDTKVVTKINRTTFHDVIDSMDLGSVIYPRYVTTEAIIGYVRAMQNSIGSNIETLYHIFDNRAEAIEFKIEKDSPVVGVPLMELALKDELLVACISRNGKIMIPRGSDMIMAGDKVIIVTTHTGFHDIKDILK